MPEWSAYHNADGASHSSKFRSFSSSGFRLTSLAVYGDPDDARYAAVWIKKAGPEWFAFHGKTANQYQDLFNDLIPRGFRPTIISATGEGDDPVFAGVFEKEGTSFKAKHGLTYAEFQSQFLSPSNYRWYLRWADTYKDDDDVTRYVGIWDRVDGQATTTSPQAFPPHMKDSGWKGYSEMHEYIRHYASNSCIEVFLDGGPSSSSLPTKYDRGVRIFHWSAREHFFYKMPLLSWHRDSNLSAIRFRFGMPADRYQFWFDHDVAHGYYPYRVFAAGEGGDARFAATFMKF